MSPGRRLARRAAAWENWEKKTEQWFEPVETGQTVRVVNRYGNIYARFGGYENRMELLATVQTLDPERPEYLMYYPDPNRDGEQALTGFMFLADGPESRGYQFAGPLAIWHYHKYTNARCWAGHGLLSTGMIDGQGRCPTGGVPLNRSPEMVHVWLIDHPRGPFATGMTLPKVVLGAGLAKRRETLGF